MHEDKNIEAFDAFHNPACKNGFVMACKSGETKFAGLDAAISLDAEWPYRRIMIRESAMNVGLHFAFVKKLQVSIF